MQVHEQPTVDLPKNMRHVDTIIIHCSATPEGSNYTIDDIRKWHLQNGWEDIGYHFVIHLDGSIHPGRPINFKGAHTYGHNEGSIGICYVGGLEKDGKKTKDTRTPAQNESLIMLVKQLITIFGPMKIYGHKQFANKACPSFEVPEWVKANRLLNPEPSTVTLPDTPSGEVTSSKLEQVIQSIKKFFKRGPVTPPPAEETQSIPMPKTREIQLDDIVRTKPSTEIQLEENIDELDAPEEPGWWEKI